MIFLYLGPKPCFGLRWKDKGLGSAHLSRVLPAQAQTLRILRGGSGQPKNDPAYTEGRVGTTEARPSPAQPSPTFW